MIRRLIVRFKSRGALMVVMEMGASVDSCGACLVGGRDTKRGRGEALGLERRVSDD